MTDSNQVRSCENFDPAILGEHIKHLRGGMGTGGIGVNRRFHWKTSDRGKEGSSVGDGDHDYGTNATNSDQEQSGYAAA